MKKLTSIMNRIALILIDVTTISIAVAAALIQGNIAATILFAGFKVYMSYFKDSMKKSLSLVTR